MRTEVLQRQYDMLSNEHSKALMEHDVKTAKSTLNKLDNLRYEIKKAKGEELIEEARKSGMFDRCSRILSAVHLLMCQANNMLSEVEDLFAEHKILLDDIVVAQKRYYSCADSYFAEFAKIVNSEGVGNLMFSDLNEFDNMFRIWAGLKDMPKPVSLMGGCKQAAGKANGLSQMCQKCPLTYNPETLICQACDKSFKEGFQKGAKWLERKRIDRIMNKDKEVKNDKGK